jgi:hypothetical protein
MCQTRLSTASIRVDFVWSYTIHYQSKSAHVSLYAINLLPQTGIIAVKCAIYFVLMKVTSFGVPRLSECSAFSIELSHGMSFIS